MNRKNRGSTWNRWDFHVHTPFSILNNNYGFAPTYDRNDNESDRSFNKKFDDFVKELFTRAIKNGIVAIGITDYFSIDGYKKIYCEYFSNQEKMLELFPDKELREQIEKIFIFPNIELRLDTFIGDEQKSLNYHVLFSNAIPINVIEQVFLNQLKVPHIAGSPLPLNRGSVELIGKEFKKNNPNEHGSDYLIGLKKITVSYDDVLNVLNNSLFKDKYFITIPVDEDLSSVVWLGRDYQTRKVLYEQCDFFLTSNKGTKNWALAKGREDKQKAEFGSIKPCIWGSDAHGYDKLFCPDRDNYCWVKAEPSFEGLTQIRYEPEDRVRIQKEKPEEKDPHQVIDCIKFDDENFSKDPIYFNEGLNCIIGGKSTGKTILLRHVAKVIDPEMVSKREEEIGKKQEFNVKAFVQWKDGESGERKIVYIPQSWLNRTVDKHGGNSEINDLIQDVLLQNRQIAEAHCKLNDSVDSIINAIQHDIISYISANNSAAAIETELKVKGRAKAFESRIKDLEKTRNELTQGAGVTPQEIESYGALENRDLELARQKLALGLEEEYLHALPIPKVYFHTLTFIDSRTGQMQYDFSSLPTIHEKLGNAKNCMDREIEAIWKQFLEEGNKVLNDKLDSINKQMSVIEKEIEPLRKAIIANEAINKIETELENEREAFQLAQKNEKDKEAYLEQARQLKEKIIQARKEITKHYDIFSEVVTKISQEGTDLQFKVIIDHKSHDLFVTVNSIFNLKQFNSFAKKYNYALTNEEDFKIDDGLFNALFDAIEAGDLVCKSGFSQQTALGEIFKDWNYPHYIVKSDGDTIDTMSPGKKALVLLELIINLEKSKCPILIDQPEDDLDNRSIYTDLVKYLKLKKHERQIIVVTHNANVVVGADAEEVIIANQDGKEAQNYEKRFEYRCGAIEDIQPVCDEDGNIMQGILNSKGIQDQICDILEGGKDAFELRKNKYFSADRY